MEQEIVLGYRLNKHTNRSSTRGGVKIWHSYIRVSAQEMLYVRMGHEMYKVPLNEAQLATIKKAVRLKDGSFGLTPHQNDVWKLDDIVTGFGDTAVTI